MDTYARMLDKKKKPTERMIEQTLGEESTARLEAFETMLRARYNLEKELRFPFGNNYGWGYKFTHGRKHLCYAFFEEGAFTVTLQLGDTAVPAVLEALPQLTPKAQALWEKRYPCGEHGGWLHDRVLEDSDLSDLITLIGTKIKPSKQPA